VLSLAVTPLEEDVPLPSSDVWVLVLVLVLVPVETSDVLSFSPVLDEHSVTPRAATIASICSMTQPVVASTAVISRARVAAE
jgi:hypothetical protein